jgi:hypothetical protein
MADCDSVKKFLLKISDSYIQQVVRHGADTFVFGFASQANARDSIPTSF